MRPKIRSSKSSWRDPKSQDSTPAAAMVKWLKSNQNLTAAVIETKNFDQLRENVGAGRQPGHGPARPRALSLLSGYNKGLTCLLCAQCVTSCPEHIGISDIFRVRNGCPGLSRPRHGREIRRLDAERHVLRRLRRLPADLLAGDRHRRQIEGCAPAAGSSCGPVVVGGGRAAGPAGAGCLRARARPRPPHLIHQRN